MKGRSIIFWIHLLTGVGAGGIVLIMSVTGGAIAFEKEILNWAERERHTVEAPSGDPNRLSLEAMRARLDQAYPGANPSGVTIDSNPAAAVRFSSGRTNTYYVNPYTGEIRPQGAAWVRGFLRSMTDWHRWLGQTGAGRPVGKAITGACNAAFLFLAVSGLYLWWPRKWTWAAVRGAAWPSLRLRGRARDWNWHNAIGFWTAPVIVVLTASGLVISYRWASDLVYRAAGETPPAPGPPALAGTPAPALGPAPLPGAQPLSHDALLGLMQSAAPRWEQMTVRLDAGADANRGQGRGRSADARQPSAASGEARHLPPVTVSVREQGAWPIFGLSQYQLDPHTGTILRREAFEDWTTGRKIRSWLRYLHTGEALGVPGKAVAAGASFGSAFLVWTGFALAWRRFRAWRRPPAPADVSAQSVSHHD